MTYNPAIHHRRSIRMHGHDYAGGGIYFVTLCAARGAGRVFDPPPMRAMLSRLWQDLPRRFPDMADDAPHAVMPDHFHGLIRLHPGSTSLGDVVCAFKSLADREYRLAVKAADARPAPTAKLWHRNYYERIIRSEHDLRTTTQYIRLNPARLIWPLPLVRAGLASALSRAKAADARPAPTPTTHAWPDAIPAIGNPALLAMQRRGMLASGNTPLAPTQPPLPTGWVLLSGGHSGQEQQAIEHTLAHNACVMLMPAVHVDAVALTTTQLTAISDGRLLVIYPFADTHTTRDNALARNRLIAEWSDALWIPAVRPGGSLQALKHAYGHKCIE